MLLHLQEAADNRCGSRIEDLLVVYKYNHSLHELEDELRSYKINVPGISPAIN